jgi:hypothetical protein
MNLNQLKDLLSLAFDAGWHGYKETKEDCIEKIIEDYRKKNLLTQTVLENNNNYYSYYCSSGTNPYKTSTSTTNINEIL